MLVFFQNFWMYIIDIAPSLALGLLISGIVHEFLPQDLIQKYLKGRSLMPLLYVILIGIILPVCCLGCLPIAMTFRKKGVSMGPILAFLVATPATSITALFVTWKLLGPAFALFLCLGVVVVALIMGIIGYQISSPEVEVIEESCPMCKEGEHANHEHHKERLKSRIKSVLTYGFIDIPKEIGVEMMIGVLIAAAVISIPFINTFFTKYLIGFSGYAFALVFGLVMYVCSTASVPLVHAFITQGLSAGAGFVLLLVGPVTSYANMLVIKKEFGMKILVIYITVISAGGLLMGYLFSFIRR